MNIILSNSEIETAVDALVDLRNHTDDEAAKTRYTELIKTLNFAKLGFVKNEQPGDYTPSDNGAKVQLNVEKP